MMMKMKMKMFGEGGAEDEKLTEHLLGTLAMLIYIKKKKNGMNCGGKTLNVYHCDSIWLTFYDNKYIF